MQPKTLWLALCATLIFYGLVWWFLTSPTAVAWARLNSGPLLVVLLIVLLILGGWFFGDGEEE